MKKYRYIFYVFFMLWLFPILVYSQKAEDMELDLFLSEAMLNDISLKPKFIHSIDYTNTGFLLISSSNQFYIIGIGYLEELFNPAKNKIEAYTVTPEGRLYLISGRDLCNIDTLGNFKKIYSLPGDNMGIASGSDQIYLFEKKVQRNKKDYSLYCLNKNMNYKKALSIATPIRSVYEYGSNLFFTSKNKLYCSNDKMKPFAEIAALPQEKDTIISIALDVKHHSFYISTKDAVYQIRDNNVEYVMTDLGGILRYDGEGLLVFNPEKSLIVRFRNNILYPDERFFPEIDKENHLTDEELRNLSLAEVRDLVIQKRINEAVIGYSYLTAKDSTNFELLAEYSYALALSGVYEGALMNLDRVRMVTPKSEEAQFYTALVFSLMGYDDLYTNFIATVTDAKKPQWISSEQISDLKAALSHTPQVNCDDYITALERTNHLTTYGMYLQSVAVYKELIKDLPDEYIPHLGYSIALEKLGFYQKAIDELDIALQMMGNSTEEAEAKKIFETRKDALTNRLTAPQTVKNKAFNLRDDFNPQMMVYAGGMFAESYLSVNGRFGWFLTNSFTGAVDLGVSGSSGNYSMNVGVSGYKYYGMFLWGEGVTIVLGETSSLALRTTAGIRVLNSSRTSSWDIMFNWNLPLGEAKSTYGISIGKSLYFGTRK
ncbi:MAG: hypothetical protein LBI03_08350 [Clostridiales bacterium]|jgi:tetratricopeptide (TPR) repeat protein|nr:hypothetical protein [Clostridiales bacterium]